MYLQMKRSITSDAARECVRRRKNISVMRNVFGLRMDGSWAVMDNMERYLLIIS